METPVDLRVDDHRSVQSPLTVDISWTGRNDTISQSQLLVFGSTENQDITSVKDDELSQDLTYGQPRTNTDAKTASVREVTITLPDINGV